MALTAVADFDLLRLGFASTCIVIIGVFVSVLFRNNDAVRSQRSLKTPANGYFPRYATRIIIVRSLVAFDRSRQM